MADLYIYYRVHDNHAAQLAPRVRTMQDRLAHDNGVAGQLKRRPGSAASLQTWMEIYPDAPDDFEALLAVEVVAAKLPELIDGARHTEIFLDLDPCA